MNQVSSTEDGDYEVSADMLIHEDIDDERTLEEEENMEQEEGEGDVQDELDDLQKESEIPLEQLLASYGYPRPSSLADPPTETTPPSPSTQLPPRLINTSGGDVVSPSKPPPPELIHVPPELPTPIQPNFPSNTLSATPISNAMPTNDSATPTTSDDKQVLTTSTSTRSPWFRPGANPEALARLRPVPERRSIRMGVSGVGGASGTTVDNAFKVWLADDVSDKDGDSSDDEDYIATTSDWKQYTKIGPDYQASIPCLLTKPSKQESNPGDVLLWSPSQLSESSTSEYLTSVSELIHSREGLPGVPCDRDNEEALHLLVQSNYDTNKGLEVFSERAFDIKGMSPWTEEECRKFETGLRTIGKDFFLLQKQVQTRSVREVVEFYYLWKKTERCDVFCQQPKNGKKFTLQPGYISDFMEEFLEPPETEFADLHYGTTTMSAEVKKERSSHSSLEDRMRQAPNTIYAKSS